MNLLIDQTLRGRTFELNHQLLDIHAWPAHNQMHVVGNTAQA
jgi:hypothetical protein